MWRVVALVALLQVASAQPDVPTDCVQWFDGCNSCPVLSGVIGDCLNFKQCSVNAGGFCERYQDGTTCVRLGSCVDSQNQPVEDPSGCTTSGCGTQLAQVPVGHQSCLECVQAGKFYSDGACAVSFIELEVDGAICSATHGVGQGLVCCNALAGGGGASPAPGASHDDGGTSHSFPLQSFSSGSRSGGCDLTMLSMKCADTDPSAVSFCSSMCRDVALTMADDCSREGISLAADALASNPCIR